MNTHHTHSDAVARRREWVQSILRKFHDRPATQAALRVRIQEFLFLWKLGRSQTERFVRIYAGLAKIAGGRLSEAE